MLLTDINKLKWNELVEKNLNMKYDKTKVWAKAELIKPTPVSYCSDTVKYHSMTLRNHEIVEVGEMPEFMGEAHKWCVIFRRQKGYHVCGFFSTLKAKQHFKSLPNLEGNLDYASAPFQRSISVDLIDILSKGVKVVGKKLENVDITQTAIDNLRKELL